MRATGAKAGAGHGSSSTSESSVSIDGAERHLCADLGVSGGQETKTAHIPQMICADVCFYPSLSPFSLSFPSFLSLFSFSLSPLSFLSFLSLSFSSFSPSLPLSLSPSLSLSLSLALSLSLFHLFIFPSFLFLPLFPVNPSSRLGRAPLRRRPR